MTKKMDRRKKYTQMVLKESFLSILEEKPISTITVKEICSTADINRSTFYAHFMDQYDLLNKIEEEIIEDMDNYLTLCNLCKEDETIQMTEKLLEYILENKPVFVILLSENGDPIFLKKVMDVAHAHIVKTWIKDSPLDTSTTTYLSTFVVSGSIHVIKKWLLTDTELSAKEMAFMINQFTLQGLSSIQYFSQK
ncbi:TetR/AcrR family transcriptional regulator [Gracilibacillus marinus]|jgi:AcrR family transcriptional regulator|uniref:TetR/AcrR family transcriptional regulator n=1 Tax=Gracilibacillus marinus TaxID=630535 RepID=A0ABV8VV20_9BACI